MSILLTPEQEKEGLKARMTKFVEGMKKLQEETQLALVAKIREDGPVIELIDNKNDTTTQ